MERSQQLLLPCYRPSHCLPLFLRHPRSLADSGLTEALQEAEDTSDTEDITQHRHTPVRDTTQ